MDPPAAQYVTTRDGHSIAYAVTGSGQPFVFLSGSMSHIQLSWQHPAFLPWLEGIASRFRLVQLDARGTGMSGRGLQTDFSFEDIRQDLEAVIDKLALKDVVLFGTGGYGAHPAVDYAVHHPDRLAALILSTPPVRSDSYKAPGLWGVLAEQDWDTFLFSSQPRDISLDERLKAVELLRQSFDQSDYLLLANALSKSDLEERLKRLRIPTLVLHPKGFSALLAEQSMRLAQIAGASMVLIDGSYSVGEADSGLRAIEAFLASLPGIGRTLGSSVTPAGLSSREVEILRLIAVGKSNRQIADELVISINTVARHVANILNKASVANRTEAAAYARERGLA